MITVFRIGQNDTRPYYYFKVRDKDGAMTLSDVTGAYFRMAVLQSGTYGSVIAGSVIISAAVIISDQLAGEGEYRWAAADTATVGEYSASILFVTALGNYSLPRNELAKVIVEDVYNTIPPE